MTATQTRLSGEHGASVEFVDRLLRLVALERGWNGGDEVRIDPGTASRALQIVSATRGFALEPVAAPVADGSILLEWTFGEDSAEVYVPPLADSPYEVVQVVRGTASEVELPTISEVVLRIKLTSKPR